MKYMALVYQDQAGLEAISDHDLEEALTNCGEWVGELERQGRHVFSAGLQSPRTGATIRQRNGRTSVTDGPFSETKEVVGGFTIFEARDLNEAIQIASRFPGTEWGSVEVRAVFDPDAQMTDPHDLRLLEAMRRAKSCCPPTVKA